MSPMSTDGTNLHVDGSIEGIKKSGEIIILNPDKTYLKELSAEV
jgi:hypothetical protein